MNKDGNLVVEWNDKKGRKYKKWQSGAHFYKKTKDLILLMKADGNLVLTSLKETLLPPLWQTTMALSSQQHICPYRLTLSSDGILSIFDGKSNAVWSSEPIHPNSMCKVKNPPYQPDILF